MAINNGTDIEMGSTLFTTDLPTAYSSGLVSADTIKSAARRSFYQLFLAGRFDPVGSNDWQSLGLETINSTLHQQIQFEAALQSFVLLKNEDNVLPLKVGQKVAVLGPMGQTRSG